MRCIDPGTSRVSLYRSLYRSLSRSLFRRAAAPLVIGAVFAAACSSSNPGGDGGAGGEGGVIDEGDGGPYTDPGPGGAFTALPLINETTVNRLHNDTVTGIHVESAGKALVVTRGAISSGASGGAVFKATSTEVTAIAYSDSADERPNFIGIERTPTGYIALTSAYLLIASRDGGAVFTGGPHGQNQASDGFGSEFVLAIRESARGITVVRSNGAISTSTATTAAAATAYTTVSSRGSGSQACARGPDGATSPNRRYSAYVNADATMIAFTSHSGGNPEICVSTDGGRTFRGTTLDVPEAAAAVPPHGVTFATQRTGIAWFGSQTVAPYIRRTTDGGATWKTVAVPADLATHNVTLSAGFFAPDGQTGWLVGYDHTDNVAVGIRTFDRGKTWLVLPGIAQAVEDGEGVELHSGFAVDATHIWLGGDFGLVIHN